MADCPDSYRDRPEPVDDPLSQILSLLDARAVVSSGLRARGGWAIQVSPLRALKCNFIKQGNCFLEVDGERWALAEGDCFLVGPDQPVLIGTDLDRLPRPAAEVFAETEVSGFAWLDAGPGHRFHCLSGRMDLPNTAGLWVEGLPPVVVIRSDQPAGERLHWLLDRLNDELASGLAGVAAMASNIMQMVFIELIRNVPGERTGSWLAALADPRIGASLRAMHRDPQRHWRIDDLASIAHLSRSRFSDRFRRAVGKAPMVYLLHWRMELARKELARPDSSIAMVAERAGYNSESAFVHAFRRTIGVTPRQSQKLSERHRAPAGSKDLRD